jgi:hypothetical protein
MHLASCLQLLGKVSISLRFTLTLSFASLHNYTLREFICPDVESRVLYG